MQSLFFTDLMQGLILFLVHLLPVDGIKMSLAKRKKKKKGIIMPVNSPVCVLVGM